MNTNLLRHCSTNTMNHYHSEKRNQEKAIRPPSSIWDGIKRPPAPILVRPLTFTSLNRGLWSAIFSAPHPSESSYTLLSGARCKCERRIFTHHDSTISIGESSQKFVGKICGSEFFSYTQGLCCHEPIYWAHYKCSNCSDGTGADWQILTDFG